MSRIADIKAPKSARALISDTATRILDAAERLLGATLRRYARESVISGFVAPEGGA